MRVICQVLALLLSVGPLASCRTADASPGNGLALAVDYFAADSARVVAKWKPACDAKGCPDSYRVVWSAGAASRSLTTTRTADTLTLARPAFGDSLAVAVTVTSVRRGVTGASRVASVLVRNPDAPPPPVDSLKADTGAVAWADSVRVLVVNPATRAPYAGVPLIAERDSVLFVMRHYVHAGRARPPGDTTAWRIGQAPAGGVATLRPFGVARDSAMFVALTCGCLESGDVNNPPLLNLGDGRYYVRTAFGGLRLARRVSL